MSLLGIDVGTSGCKAGLYREDGERAALAYREYDAARPAEGRAELDSREVVDKVFAVIAEATAAAADDPVKALCVSSMGEAVTPVSADRELLGPSILSSDLRGEEYVAQLRAEIDQESFYAINPNILGVQYSWPKLRWIQDSEPELYERADKFLLWSDLIGYLLGAEAMTSHALANRTLLFDIHKEDWSDRLLEIGGIDRTKLAPTAPSGAVAGKVGPEMAERLGLTPDTLVVVGAHDQCCVSLGAGVCRPGMAVCGIGTFECITPTYDFVPAAADMLKNGLNVEHHSLPGLYVSFIYNQGGALLKWFRDTFARADRDRLGPDENIFDVLTAETPAEPTRLMALPYFEMTGPPGFVADASGVIAGLKMDTSRGDILKAIMEGETFYFVESLKALEDLGVDASEFVATGGGARSDTWLQIKADIFGVPFVRAGETEAGILGAVILSGLAAGAYADAAQACEQLVRRERVFEPDAKRHEIYVERHEKYRQLFPLMRDYLAAL